MSTLKATTEDLFALRAQGLKMRDIAARTGLSLSCVSSRLGLKVAKPRKAPEGQQRKCLCCEHTFWSSGPGNRLCNSCRRQSAGPFDTPHAVSTRR